MLLGDSTASTVFLMFPRMRLRRAVVFWLALLIAHAALAARPHPRVSPATVSRAASAGLR